MRLMASYPNLNSQQYEDLQRQIANHQSGYPRTYISGGTYLGSYHGGTHQYAPSYNALPQKLPPMSFEDWKKHGKEQGHLDRHRNEVLSEPRLEHPSDKVHLKPMDPIVVDKVDNIRMPIYGNQGGSSSPSQGISQKEEDRDKPTGPPEVEDKTPIQQTCNHSWIG